MEATKDPIAFFAYVSFFPQLVAGPIERASNLLPQFFEKKVFDYSQGTTGLKLILWGLFKKIVIADNCAHIVNSIFQDYTHVSGLELIFGAILFAFQIYGDFSGYSDIAIGTGKLLGFDLMTNFKTPYFSRDIGEFWRRWHISLSSWFKDYVYIPLGGSRGTKLQSIRNIFIIFLVSGFWHGANWTFLAWGGLNAFYFLPVFLLRKNKKPIDFHEIEGLLPNLKSLIQISFTFGLTCLAWIFFRSPTVGDAWQYLSSIFNQPFFPSNYSFINYDLRLALVLFIVLEWLGKRELNFLVVLPKKRWRYGVYAGLCYLLVYWGVFGEPIEFIYFQF
ncbi:MBOAT family O-acyltransferase [Algoriphagus sp. CAU 1675]|uniref:MBOAT family O-acyltransferase n=1 Tax=Algoriphagus sp. CAU 1675 TaxID=3032597 RepID=UPI0023D9C3BF|nr:MBOAT family O-acyltransferase [Algoriphagus sp. CAU 1675]MDF2159411.1 hypothetical protein [Algoriphagus sp. CAU 1675]